MKGSSELLPKGFPSSSQLEPKQQYSMESNNLSPPFQKAEFKSPVVSKSAAPPADKKAKVEKVTT